MIVSNTEHVKTHSNVITRPKLINQHEQKFVRVHLPILDFSCSNSIRSDISSAITRPSMVGVLSMMIVWFCLIFCQVWVEDGFQ